MTDIEIIKKKVLCNQRLDADDAVALFDQAELLDLADLAGHRRRDLHPELIVTFVSDRNINYTNVCASGCKFCAFFRPPGHKDGYVLKISDLDEKIKETLDLGGTQILLQGGMNPELDLNYYINLLQHIKNNFKIHIHGFSPTEIAFIADLSSLSIKEVLEKLIQAGLGSIPGGGAEILVDEVRQKISPNKCSSGTWLEVMRTAHHLGLKTTATMMFGHVETQNHIIEHLLKLRALQDETNGFTAFIPWTFQPGNTHIHVTPTTAVEYLRILAISRLVLDNIPNLQVSWVTQGDKIAQLGLAFGANDFGSTMIEENVVAAAGVKFRLPRSEIVRLIEDAGYAAQQRDCFYNVLDSKK